MTRALTVVVCLLIAACSSPAESRETDLGATTTTTTPSTTTTVATATTSTEPVAFSISSPAFGDGEAIPSIYTCDGLDISPELVIAGIPPGTVSLVLILNDPDASLGTWDHWVEYDIDARTREVERGVGAIGTQGENSWKVTGYGGPCPPEGEEHRYVFTVYALGRVLGLPSGAGSDVVYEAIDGRVIDQVELVGFYER